MNQSNKGTLLKMTI